MKVFNYTKSSTYLKNHISELPKRGRGESKRYAETIGVSTTLMSQIISGEKLLTFEQAEALTHVLGFTQLETEYFLFLIQYERAGTPSLKKFWFEKLTESKKKSLSIANRVHIDKSLTDQERAIFYSSPLYSSIRLYCSVGKKGKSVEEIAERFKIPRAKAVDITNFLISVGLCEVENDKIKMGVQTTHLERGSPFLSRHLMNWRTKSLNKIDQLSEAELMYSCPVSISKKDFEKLRNSMASFITEFINTVKASPEEEIACFNIDWFWIDTEIKD